MRRSTLLLGAAAVACLGVAGGTAFTNSNTAPTDQNSKIGFVTFGVTGAVIDSVHYQVNSVGRVVTGVTVAVQGDTSPSTMTIGFNTGTVVDCAAGTYAAGPPALTTYQCDVTTLATAPEAITDVKIIVR